MEARIAPAAFTWSNPAGGSWSVPANWSVVGADADGIPDADDDVTINPAAAGVVVSISAGTQSALSVNMPGDDALWIFGGGLVTGSASTISNFQLSSGTLTATGQVTLRGTGVWSGNSTIEGTVRNEGTLSIFNDPNLGGTLSNAGLIQSDARFDFVANGRLENLAGGVFDITSVADGVSFGNFGGLGFFNSGTLRHSGTGNNNLSSVPFSNAAEGVVQVTAGALGIGSDGTWEGADFLVGAGTQLRLDGGTKNWAGSYTGSGAGTVVLTGGTFAVGLGGATLNFPAGLFTWTNNSTFNGGPLTNAATSTLQITGDPNLSTTLTNLGTIFNDARFDFVANGRLDNAAGAVFDITSGADGVSFGDFGGVGFFNSGTLRHSGTGNNNLSSVPFSNAAGGIVQVTAGALGIGSNGTWEGANFLVGAGTQLRLDGGTKNWTGTYTGSGVGTVVLTGGTFAVGPGGATLNFPAGFFTWTNNSTFTGGPLTNAATSTLQITGDPNLSTTLTNLGTIFNDARLDFEANGRLDNAAGAVFDITSGFDGVGFGDFGGTGFFNSGTLRHSGTGNNNLSSVPFSNAAGGIVQVTAGALGIGSNGTWEGANFLVGTGTQLRLDGGTKNWTGTYTGSGAGTVVLTGGTFAVGPGGATLNFPAGFFTWTNNSTINGGPLTNAATSTLQITGDPNLGTTLTNLGTIFNDARFDFVANGRLDNAAGAVFDITSTADGVSFGSFGGVGFFNSGTLRHSGTGNNNLSSVPFSNAAGGIVQVTSGALGIGSDGTWEGANFLVGSGTQLRLEGGTKNWTGTYTGSGPGSVVFTGGTITVGQGGATLNFPAGLFTWTNDSVINGGTLTNAATGTMQVTGDPNLGTTLTNLGTIFNDARFDFAANGRLDNAVGAVFDITSGADGGSFGNFGGPGFFNSGTFRHSGVGNNNVSTVPFHNSASGYIDVTAGALGIGSSGTWEGAEIVTATGTHVRLEGGTKTWTGVYTGGGGGEVRFIAGTITIGANGATLDFPEGKFFVYGNPTFNGQPFTNTGFMRFQDDPNLDTTLNNAGTIRNNARFDFTSEGRLNNLPGAVFEITGTGGDGSYFGNFGGPGIFNQGTLRKLGPASANVSTVPFNNLAGGKIEVLEGSLGIGSSGSWEGAVFDIAVGTHVRLEGGTKTWTGLFTGTGGGEVRFFAGTLTFGQDGATLDFPEGQFAVSGNPTFNGQPFTNTGFIQFVDNDPNLGTTLNNSGTIHNNSRLDFVGGGRVNNLADGVFNITGTAGNGSYFGSFGGAGFFNDGVFRKLGPAGANSSTVPFSNAGVVEIVQGTFGIGSLPQLTGPTNAATLNGGTWIVRNGTTLDIPGTGIASNFASIELEGTGALGELAALSLNAGTLKLSGGKDLTRTGALQNTGTLIVGPGSVYTINGGFTQGADGRLEIELAGTPGSGNFGTVAISGVAALGGTLATPAVGGFAPSAGESYALMTFASRTGTFSTYEGGGESFAPVFELVTNPGEIRINSLIAAADLSIASASVPSSGTLGGEITISYTVENLQNRPSTVSEWTDAIYLSRDGTFDESDFLFARIPHTGGLGALGSYTENVTRRVPGLPEGDYQVIIVADNRRIVPDLDRTNNDLLPGTSVAVSISTLTFGVPLDGVIAEGQDFFFKMTLPSGPDVFLTADFELPNAAEFYVRKGAVPDRTHFDLKASNLADLEKQIRLLNPRGGEYFILLHGREGASPDSDFSIVAESAPFVLDSIGQSFGANAGRVTVPLVGGGFTSALGAELRPTGGGTPIVAQSIRVVDSFNAFATFDLSGVSPGDFSIAALQDGAERIITDSFDVVAGEQGRFEARLIVPQAVRMTRPFQITVEFENDGGTDVEVPLLVLDGAANNFVWATGEEQSRMTPKLQFLAVNPDGYSGGVLRPGEKHSVTFNAVTNSTTAKFTLSSTAGDSTEAVNFNTLGDSLRPDSAPAFFDTAFDTLAGKLGTNYGDLIDDLVEASDSARALGEKFFTLPQTFGFLIRQEMLELPAANVRGTVFDGDALHDAGFQRLYLRNIANESYVMTSSFIDGSFGFFDVPAGTYELSVEGFASHNLGTITVPATGILDGLEVIGDPGQVLSGRIADGAGRSVFNAMVVVTDANGNQYVTQSDRSGQYRVSGLAAGTATLDVTAPGLVPLDDVQLSIAVGAPANGDLVLSTGGAVTGRVLAPGGGPRAGVEVVAQLVGGGFTQKITTDFFGRFRVGGLLPGTYEIIADDDTFGAGVLANILVGDGATTPVADISLTNPGNVTGTITDLVTGLPIAGARFGPTSIGQQDDPFLSGLNGVFTANGLTAGSFTALVTAPGYNPALAQITLAAGEQEVVNVALRPLGKIDGVVQAAGGGIGGAKLTLLPISDGPEAESYTVVSASNGSFSFAGLPDGEYSLSLDAAGGSVARQTFVLNSSDNTFTTTLDLGASTVTGALRDTGGTPLPFEAVSLFSGGRQIDTVLTDANGNYRFLVFQSGAYDLIARGETAGIAAVFNVDVTAGQVVTVSDIVAGGASLTVDVDSAADSSALGGALVVVRSTLAALDDLTFGGFTNATGQFELPRLTPGEYEISVTKKGFATERQVMTVSGGGTVDFDLDPGRVIMGTLRDELGNPVVLGEVTFFEQATGDTFTSYTDENGNYVRDTLAGGVYDIAFTNDSLRPVVIEDVTITQQSTRVDATLATTSITLNGTVSDLSGDPLAQVVVRVLGPGDVTILSAVTDANGGYELANLPAGAVRVAVTPAGFLPVEISINLPSTGATTQNISTGEAVAAAAGAVNGASAAPLFESSFFVASQVSPDSIRGLLTRGLLDGGSGDFASGLQPPARFDADTAEFRFGLPLPDLDCPDQTAAHDAAFDSALLVDQAYDAYKSSFDALKGLNDADVAEFVTLSKEILLDGVNLADGVSGFKDLLESYATRGTSIPDLAKENVALIKSGLEGVLNNVRAGKLPDISDITFIGDQFKSLLGLGTDVDFNTGEVSLGGDFKKVLLGGTPIAGDLMKLYDKFKALNDKVVNFTNNDLKNRLGDYEGAQDRYLEAVAKHKANRDKLAATLNKTDDEGCGGSGGGGTDEDPEDPEEQNPEDEETVPTVGSRDPNDIIGPTGFGAQNWIAADSLLAYTIRFENVSTATAPAQEVFITQTLDNNLDPATFEIGDFGFAGIIVDVPDGSDFYSTRLDLRDTLGMFVDFEGKLDVNTGIASWTFRSIDPNTLDVPGDPFAGFLPPNLFSPEGEGFVSYSVKADSSAASGTVIDAQARIVFDLNDPIDTPAIFNTLDAEEPTSAIGGLAGTTASPRFPLTITSGDGAGSGVHSVDIYVSDNGGPFTLFVNDFSGSSISFRGEDGHTYGFATVAKDNVGLTENLPLVADTTTTVDFEVLPFSKTQKQTFTDVDGDIVTVSLSGNGQGGLVLDDPDGDGKGSLDRITLASSDTKTKLTVTVKKNKNGGDGVVTIGDVTVAGSLGAFLAKSSDLTINGFSASGTTKSIVVRDLIASEPHLGTPAISLGGTNVDKTIITARTLANGVEVNTPGIISAFTASSIGDGSITAAALGKLTTTGGAMNADLAIAGNVGPILVKQGANAGSWTAGGFGLITLGGTLDADIASGGNTGAILLKAGSINGDIDVTGKITSATVKAGAITGQLTGASIGAVSITGGNMSGFIGASSAPAKTKGLASLTVTGGSITGDVLVSGNAGPITAKENTKTGVGGGISGDITANSLGALTATGGDVSGTIKATGAAAALGKTLALAKLTVTGGDLLGDVVLSGGVGAISVKADKAGNGGSIIDVNITAAKIAALMVGKNLNGSRVLAGTSLGADNAPGGGDDTFLPGSIGAVNVGGSVVASVVAAGLSNPDGTYNNGDDTLLGITPKITSTIAALLVKGTADSESYFAAGKFVGKPKINNTTVNPATDSRFKVV